MSKFIKKMLSKYLLVTNTLTTGTLLAVGDFVTQTLEIKYSRDEVTQDYTQSRSWTRTDEKAYRDKKSSRENYKIDLLITRTTKVLCRMFTIGIILGPFNHLWYNTVIEKIVTATGTSGTLKRILADQAVAGPFFCSSFFFGMGMLEGKGFDGAVQEVKDKFLTVYLIDWMIWPPAQFINFYFLPKKIRVIYVSFITLNWNVFLSWFKHRDQHSKEDEKKKS